LTRSASPGHELVIFDCDGVLVDSEPIANRVFAEMLAAEGLVLSPRETMRRYMGRSMAACRALVEAELGRALPGDFFTALHARTLGAFQNELRRVDGIGEVLDRLQHHFAWPAAAPMSGCASRSSSRTSSRPSRAGSSAPTTSHETNRPWTSSSMPRTGWAWHRSVAR
jgi:beta-phosphoglucomutase-like phosphatase (HAD superfamily)